MSLYPVTIIMDRYGGVYSEGKYVAFPMRWDSVPEGCDADDVTCSEFWGEVDKAGAPAGVGDSPNEAMADLEKKAKGLSKQDIEDRYAQVRKNLKL